MQAELIATGAEARFSPDGRYRYKLVRQLSAEGPTVGFCMMNCSIADAFRNDPTIYGNMKRARLWGFARYVSCNLFAMISTDPKALLTAAEPIGPDNDAAIMECARESDLFVCAWGQKKYSNIGGRADYVEKMLRDAGIKLHVLKLSKDGTPMHPLYIFPYSMGPTEWEKR